MSDIILIFAYSRSSYGVMARRNKSSLSSKKHKKRYLVSYMSFPISNPMYHNLWTFYSKTRID